MNVRKHHNLSRSSLFETEITSSLFVRRITLAIGGMFYIAVVYAYALSSITSSGLLPWISLSQTRSQVMDVDIVPLPSPMSVQSELIWWFIPVLSLLLCILCALGEETRNGYRFTSNWLSQRFQEDVLPLQYVLDIIVTNLALTQYLVSGRLARPRPSRFIY